MKTKMIKISFFIFFTALFPVLAAGTEPELYSLKIHLTGFKHSNGQAKVAIVNSKENYADTIPFKGFNFKIINNQVVQTVYLPKGEYAVKAYHDENTNDRLDKRAMGMPKERYGFSNNAYGMFGPPDYEKVSFKLNALNQTISITLK